MSSFVRLGAFYVFLCVLFWRRRADPDGRRTDAALTRTTASFDWLETSLVPQLQQFPPCQSLIYSLCASGCCVAQTRLVSVWPCLCGELTHCFGASSPAFREDDVTTPGRRSTTGACLQARSFVSPPSPRTLQRGPAE